MSDGNDERLPEIGSRPEARTRSARKRSGCSGEKSTDPAAQMLFKLKKVVGWLDMLAAQALRDERNNRGRFDALADSCRADARNYQGVGKDLLVTIALVDPQWVEKWSWSDGRR